MAKFKLTWVADAPEYHPFNIIGAGLQKVLVPREFSDTVDALMLESALDSLRKMGARNIRCEEVHCG